MGAVDEQQLDTRDLIARSHLARLGMHRDAAAHVGADEREVPLAVAIDRVEADDGAVGVGEDHRVIVAQPVPVPSSTTLVRPAAFFRSASSFSGRSAESIENWSLVRSARKRARTTKNAMRGGSERKARRANESSLRRCKRFLPAVVSEGLVGLRHAEDVVLPLEGAALEGLRIQEFVGQPLSHRLSRRCARTRRASEWRACGSDAGTSTGTW